MFAVPLRAHRTAGAGADAHQRQCAQRPGQPATLPIIALAAHVGNARCRMENWQVPDQPYTCSDYERDVELEAYYAKQAAKPEAPNSSTPYVEDTSNADREMGEPDPDIAAMQNADDEISRPWYLMDDE